MRQKRTSSANSSTRNNRNKRNQKSEEDKEKGENPFGFPKYGETPQADPGFTFYPPLDSPPVDPRDCELYPDSPWCGGNPLTTTPVGFEDNEITYSECGVSACTTPVVGFIKLPKRCVVYTRDTPDCGITYPSDDRSKGNYSTEEDYSESDIPLESGKTLLVLRYLAINIYEEEIEAIPIQNSYQAKASHSAQISEINLSARSCHINLTRSGEGNSALYSRETGPMGINPLYGGNNPFGSYMTGFRIGYYRGTPGDILAFLRLTRQKKIVSVGIDLINPAGNIARHRIKDFNCYPLILFPDNGTPIFPYFPSILVPQNNPCKPQKCCS